MRLGWDTLGAAGFWLAGVASLVVAAGILFAYFLHVAAGTKTAPRELGRAHGGSSSIFGASSTPENA